MQIQVKNIQGKELKNIEIPEEVFGLELNDHILYSAVKAYRANRRQGTHATLNFRRVSGTGKKPFKQKGSGTARQGSTIAPHMRGGAVAHGPMPRSYREHINKKVKNLALCVALSDKLRAGKLTVVDKFSMTNYKTKNVLAALKALNANKALFSDVAKAGDDFLYRSVRNIYGSNCLDVTSINAENILAHEDVILSESAVEALVKRLGG